MNTQLREPESETHARQPEAQTFVETALKLGGKSEEEARKTGTLDRADDQVEALFAARYQTVNSPAHRAVWDHQFPAELFAPEPPRSRPSARRRCATRSRSRAGIATPAPCSDPTARSPSPCWTSWAPPATGGS